MPLDKVRLVSRYARQDEAADKLLDLDVTRAAFASVMGGKDGHKLYTTLRNSLINATGQSK